MSQKIFIRPQTRKRTDAIKEKNSLFFMPFKYRAYRKVSFW